MKKNIVITSLFLLFAVYASGQESACDSVHTIVDQMPVYGNSMSDFYNDFGKIKFTKQCQPQDITGVSWVVDEEGKMIDIEIRSMKKECKTLFYNQMQRLPRWTPGRNKGKLVCVKMALPIHIRP